MVDSQLITIISDGTGWGTRVVMPDGTPIPGLLKATWECSSDSRAIMKLIGHCRCELSAGAEIKTIDKPVKRVPLHWRKPEDRA